MSKDKEVVRAYEAGVAVLTAQIGVQHLTIRQLQEERSILRQQIEELAAKVSTTEGKVAQLTSVIKDMEEERAVLLAAETP